MSLDLKAQWKLVAWLADSIVDSIQRLEVNGNEAPWEVMVCPEWRRLAELAAALVPDVVHVVPVPVADAPGFTGAEDFAWSLRPAPPEGPEPFPRNRVFDLDS